MFRPRTGKEVVRRSFGRIKNIVPVPDLIEIQSKSFNDFAQLDFLPQERSVTGLEKVFRDIFPIEYEDKMSLEYVSYELGQWACTCGKLTGIENRYSWVCEKTSEKGNSRLSPEQMTGKKPCRYVTCPNCLSRVGVKLPLTLDECRANEQSFTMPLKVRVQLITWDTDEKGKRSVRDIKEQDIFFVDVPVMADLFEEKGQFKLGSLGTFLINGIDRVIVSQLHRSPGVVFSQNKKARDSRGREALLARIIPMRGSWIDFEYDSNDYLFTRIDKKKKILVTTLLQALGYKRSEIISLFYPANVLVCQKGVFYQKIDDSLIGLRIEKDMLDSSSAEKNFVGKRITKDLITRLKKAGFESILFAKNRILNHVVAQDIVHPKTGEILLQQGQLLDEETFNTISSFEKFNLHLIASSGCTLQPTIPLVLAQDKCFSQEEALKEIHNKVWPGDNASVDEIKERIDKILFNPRFYDLTRVGRLRINRKLGLNVDETFFALTKEDIVATIRYLVNLRERSEGSLDDIDHLGNRRVRLVGELLANQIYLGMLRVERIARERFRLQEVSNTLMPQDFLNIKPLNGIIREFFGTGQLSQFMDQTNPLAEIAHKRRLSALGPGGVTKDRATYEVRDVHTSHYGRICPIETPEGQTIGLISSLATYAYVNDLGFIETAYRKVDNGSIKQDVLFLDAFEETNKYIAQADSAVENNKLQDEHVWARYNGDFMYAPVNKIDYIDLSSKQLVSVATALIPFLEHDDASRALMGSNMQRQAVPLARMQVPIVGTGMEQEIAYASGSCVSAKLNGMVEYVSSEKIIVHADQDQFATFDDWVSQGIQIYHLKKFQGSSHSTCINQSPIVTVGERVVAGQLLTNSSAILNGELALGTNLLVAFMPWRGFNFEDAIVLNKKLVAEDILTSVHIEEYEIDARDTKLGPEEITKDIPNVSESVLAGLDGDGIVRVGTRVKPGDILVGKVTLKGDVQSSPEEKLLRAIFGEKSREVRDTSLRVPPGDEGTVIDVKIFSRSGVRKDQRYKDVVAKETTRLQKEMSMQLSLLEKNLSQKIFELIESQGVTVTLGKKEITSKVLKNTPFVDLLTIKVDKKDTQKEIEQFKKLYDTQVRVLNGLHEERVNFLKKGDPLPSGVIKKVKVYIATKRPIQAGDKLAGRHGNKGVVSTIVPREDMPFLDDGTAVDIVLNPLGVPSRMNVGQILETLLGFAGKKAGEKLQEVCKQHKDALTKKALEEAYGKEFVDEYSKDFGKEELQTLLDRTIKTGVLYRTPVFDGADFDQDIKPILEQNNIPLSGSFMIRDGRTGEYFDQPVTVGCIYMMKLDHMVDDKLHARSVGPYSLVTQQPLGGKAQMGGQRLGEMEVWALQAYGAAYTLSEMLTYKSDDVGGRHKVYDAIVRGEKIPEPGLPESFNVLIKEFQSLGIKVDLFKSAKEDIGE
ncbi:MAG: DNA-directed RNA polymerase subunit beta [candidate division TM6 bacterium GW2011_GWE2_41_16]|nr:MAG: DNA-directed RNA polymerase subunit beta [candidate division TM6 bacterium GW2011_GWE2_41_16]